MAERGRFDELRVFVSSTFQDLQDERDYLVRRIFPKIRTLCRRRGLLFTEIDLRWGLTDEESARGRIIGACLDEVDRCRPYFIGIFGGRYGWTPSVDELYRDPDLFDRFAWLESAAFKRMSLMEMEVRHAILEGASSSIDRSIPLFYEKVDDQVAPGSAGDPSDSERLGRLVSEVRDAGFRVTPFSSVEQLGQQVLDDLRDLVERDFPNDPSDDLDREREYHDAFAAARAGSYIPNGASIERLDAFIDGTDDPILVVEGPSGRGKSALMAYWVDHLRVRRPDVLTIEHYVGVGSGSGDRSDVLHHLYLEIDAAVGAEHDIPESPDRLVGSFPSHLALLGDRPTVILIDGVNQLPEGDRDLGWIPQHLPGKVQVIATSTEPLRDELGEIRDWTRFLLPPLDRPEREAMILRFLGRFHKGLGRRQIDRIASDERAAQPIFLRTLLEELRVHGYHEQLDEAIDRYLAASDTADLFRILLERLEEDFGRDDVVETMSLIWASRDGLAHGELDRMTAMSTADLALLLSALDYHLLRRGALYTFFHDFLADAVESRYLSDPSTRRRMHRRVADYFASEPIDDRRCREQPWCLNEAGDTGALLACLCDPDLFCRMAEGESRFELIEYWRGIDGGERRSAYERMLEGVRSTNDFRSLSRAVSALAATLLLSGEASEAERIARYGLEQLGERPERTDRVRLLDLLGTSLVELGRYDEAAEVLQRAVEAGHGQGRTVQGETVDGLIALATGLYRKLDLDEAQAHLQQALILAEELGDAARIFDCASGLGALFHRNRNYEAALTGFERSAEIVEQQGWWNTERGAECLNNLGSIYREQGEYEKAARSIARALEINERLYGSRHFSSIRLRANLGLVYKSQGNLDLAESMLRTATSDQAALHGLKHPDTAGLMLQLAIVLKNRMMLEEASHLVEQARCVREELVGADHVSTIQCWLVLADIRRLSGDDTGARTLYREYLPKKRELLGEEHPSYKQSLAFYRKLLEEFGE